MRASYIFRISQVLLAKIHHVPHGVGGRHFPEMEVFFWDILQLRLLEHRVPQTGRSTKILVIKVTT